MSYRLLVENPSISGQKPSIQPNQLLNDTFYCIEYHSLHSRCRLLMKIYMRIPLSLPTFASLPEINYYAWAQKFVFGVLDFLHHETKGYLWSVPRKRMTYFYWLKLYNMADEDETCAIAEIKNKTNQCFESRKHANCLLDIIGHSEVTYYVLYFRELICDWKKVVDFYFHLGHMLGSYDTAVLSIRNIYNRNKQLPKVSHNLTVPIVYPFWASQLKGGGNRPTGLPQVNSGGGGIYFMRAWSYRGKHGSLCIQS
jgi:hypothetical protein